MKLFMCTTPGATFSYFGRVTGQFAFPPILVRQRNAAILTFQQWGNTRIRHPRVVIEDTFEVPVNFTFEAHNMWIEPPAVSKNPMATQN